MLLANFDRKEHLQHRAVSLQQHGFLVFQNVWMSEIKHCCRWSAENEQNFISECVTVPLVFLEIYLRNLKLDSTEMSPDEQANYEESVRDLCDIFLRSQAEVWQI